MNNKKRKFRTSDQWAAIIQDYKESGLSKAAFCRKNNIAPNTFYRHNSLYKEEKHLADHYTPVFVPLEVPQAETGRKNQMPQGIDVSIGTATLHVLPGFDHDFLSELVSVLGGIC